MAEKESSPIRRIIQEATQNEEEALNPKPIVEPRENNHVDYATKQEWGEALARQDIILQRLNSLEAANAMLRNISFVALLLAAFAAFKVRQVSSAAKKEGANVEKEIGTTTEDI